MADPLVVWRAQIWADGSSAIISRELVLAMRGLDMPVVVDDLNPARTAPLLADDERRRRLRELCQPVNHAGPTVRVRAAAPEPHETDLVEGAWDIDPGAEANVAFYTLPNAYLPATARTATGNALLDQVWACSDYVAGTLTGMGFDERKVRVVNLGYAPDVFHPRVQPADLPTDRRFRFVHASIPYVTYKGIDVLVAAYYAEFSGADDVCLVLQTRPRAGAEDAVRRLVAEHQARRSDPPEVLFLPVGYDQPSLAQLFAATDCYVQTSRCEGFGMPVLEAMACGIPTVAVGFGGHLGFCTPRTSYLVDYTLGPPPAGAYVERLSSIPTWAEPDPAHLRDRMRYAFEHADETRTRGRAGADLARSAFTWAHAAGQARAHLGALS